MTANPSLPLIEVEGPAESRGLAYGRAADSRIKKGVEQYQSFFETREITSKSPPFIRNPTLSLSYRHMLGLQ